MRTPPATIEDSSPQRFQNPHFPDCSPDSGTERAFRGREPDLGQATAPHARAKRGRIRGIQDTGWLDKGLGGRARASQRARKGLALLDSWKHFCSIIMSYLGEQDLGPGFESKEQEDRLINISLERGRTENQPAGPALLHTGD